MTWKHAIIPTLLAAVVFTCGCHRKDAISVSPDEKAINQSVSSDENSINQSVELQAKALSQGDIDGVVTLWKDDALLINLTTNKKNKGKDALVSYLQKQLGKNPPPMVSMVVSKIHFPNSSSAIVNGVARVTYDNAPPEERIFRAEYVKQGDMWRVQKASEMEVFPMPSHQEELKELAWLVGNWEDTDEDMEIHSWWRWAGNKNFLVQTFSSTILGQKDIRGKQILGWDPAEKRLRSWIFDSEGGFGKCYWSRIDGSWYASTIFTLPDGRKASATHIYKKIDNDTYQFSCENRDVDGRLLPNIGPYKVVRSK